MTTSRVLNSLLSVGLAEKALTEMRKEHGSFSKGVTGVSVGRDVV